jgi:hypothetical protein
VGPEQAQQTGITQDRRGTQKTDSRAAKSTRHKKNPTPPPKNLTQHCVKSTTDGARNPAGAKTVVLFTGSYRAQPDERHAERYAYVYE